MRTYNLVMLSTPILIDGIPPLEKFSRIPVSAEIRNFLAFSCPDYVLNNALQGGNPSKSRKAGAGWESTLGHIRIMPDLWRWS